MSNVRSRISYRFTPVPHALRELAAQKQINGNSYLVWCYLLECHNSGAVVRKVSTIATATGTGTSTVKRSLSQLVEAGVLEVESRQRADGCRATNSYTLKLPEGSKWSSSMDQNGPPPGTKMVQHLQELLSEEEDPMDQGSGPKKTKKAKKPKPKITPEAYGLPLTEKLTESLSEFTEHRRLLRRPLNDLAAKRIGAKLRELPEREQIACLDRSIESGWLGVFPDKGEKSSGGERDVDPASLDPKHWRSVEARQAYREASDASDRERAREMERRAHG